MAVAQDVKRARATLVFRTVGGFEGPAAAATLPV